MATAFLDANVLFSAAYLPASGLRRLWNLPGVTLFASPYVYEEARLNLLELDDADEKVARLMNLCGSVTMVMTINVTLDPSVILPDKDVPVLLAAVECRAEFLITGDKEHFGRYYGQKIQGVLVTRPADFLKLHSTAPATGS